MRQQHSGNMRKECRFCKYYYVRNYTPNGFIKCRVHIKKEKTLSNKLPPMTHTRVSKFTRLMDQSGISICTLDCNDCPLTSNYCNNSDFDEHCKYIQKFLS